MESPDESRKVPPAAARASPSKDSPFYNYISNLSPLNQNKDTRVGQRLFNVRSPPPVFTSPRETKLLERIQMSELSTADLLTLCGTENEISSVVPSVSHSSAAQVILIPYAHAFDKVTGDAENQSPPGSIDKYLADTSEECENFSCPCPPNLHSDKFVELPHNFKASAKCADERSLTNDGNQNNQKDVKIKAGTQIISAESTPESLLKGTLLVDANVDVRIIQKIDKRATKIVQHMDNSNVPGADSSHSSASAESRYLRDPTLTGIGRNEHDKQMRDASLSTHECYTQETQALKEHEIGMTSQVNLEQEMVPCSDLLQNIDLDQFCMENLEMEAQRGAPRRCLQFQAGGKNVAKIKTSRSLSTTPQIMFHDTGSSMETLETPNINTCGKIDGAVGTKLMPNPCQHASSAVKLHASSSLRDGNRGSNLSTDVKTNSFVAAHIPSGIGLHLNSIGKARVGINIQKGQYFSDNGHTLTEDVKSLLPGSSKSLRISPLHLNECGLSPAPNDQKDPAESENCKVEDIDRMSPKNIRKRSADSNGDEECRRCNCKKSKCLKLYCECFAAGLYCSKPCSCQGCFNKPEYEDKVMETRQLIESRNPIAFAPKVVHCVAVSPKNVDEEGNKTTPASARHKRGCNCKKSMCLKKYCECFQAGVGCSDACRCEGCKNLFGRKEGIISLNHLKAERARWRKEPEGKSELADTILEMEPSEENDDVLQVGHCLGGPPSPRSLFRCSNRELVLPRSWQHPKRHLTSSPDSESSAASTRGKSPNSSMKSSLSVRVLKASAQDLDIQLPGKKNIMTSSWNGLIDSRNVLPTRDYQSIGCASSSNPCLKSSQTMQSHVRLSKAHGSPITPVSRFGNTKYEDPLGNSSSKYLEDETPEILKETRSPIKAVKANSPNQKRVSPPQDCSEGIRPTTISPSVRSGRRFVLQSVPSFPPLTPYKDSKKSEK